ncbi:MAG: ABC transporter substrate-binding protein [Gammaproteobacteria bacterium]|nr:ABC transporter substrate-binding protein [Gammaproteobacteria bacterium]
MKSCRILITLTLCLFLSPSFANPYQRYPASPQAVQQTPADVLKRAIEQLTHYLGNREGKNVLPLEVFVENNIAPFFDFAYMTKWTAGHQARFMNPQQATAMQQKLRRLFLAGMVEKLSEYRHGHVKYLRPTGNSRTGEITLRLLAYQQGSPYPQRLNFRMYRSNQGWKVFDVSSNGQSALAFYRTQFSIEARNQRRQNYSRY